MIFQKDFNDTISRFEELEKRGSFYPMFLNLIEKGFKVEAFAKAIGQYNYVRITLPQLESKKRK